MSKAILFFAFVTLLCFAVSGEKREKRKSHCTLKSCKRLANPAKWPGENGKPVVLNAKEKQEAENTFSEHYFNLVVSDKIALNRSIPPVPIAACRHKRYDARNFPKISVIIVFYNEAYSTLMRSLHSIINRTPVELLQEIILVDDGSLNASLSMTVKENLEEFDVNLVLSRLEERQGLIAAKIHGATLAKGKVLVFLDSHIEVNTKWVEPLLYEIQQNPKAVPCPIIDVIKYDTFEYLHGSDQVWGEFDWYLVFTWNAVPENVKVQRERSPATSYRSPEMAGGIFAIDRDYFFKMGAYDDEIKWWGAENLEMSLRIWQCGGQILIVPCSRVGHVYREKNPHEFPGGQEIVLLRNYGRVAEVWLDEFRHIFYAVNPGYQELSVDLGDLSDRFALKKKLRCKSFRWYLKNIFSTSAFPTDFKFVSALMNTAQELCIDINNHESSDNEISVSVCSGLNSLQAFAISESGHIRNNKLCLEVDSKDNMVRLRSCSKLNKKQKWIINFDESDTALINSYTKSCLAIDEESEKLIVSPCADDDNLKWSFYEKRMDEKTPTKEEL